MNPTQDEPPRRPELKKYQAGYFLIALTVALFSLGLVLEFMPFFLVGTILGVTGIVFQFDKSRDQKKR